MVMRLSDFRALPSQQKNFIRAFLHLRGSNGPTEHDLCGLWENFDLRTRWRNAIGAVQAMSHFVKGNGVNNNKKDQLILSSDEEDYIGSRSGLPSSRATPELDSKRQQQLFSCPSPDDRALRGGLAGLVAKGTPKMSASESSSSPKSFSDALNMAKAKATSETETEEAREGPCADNDGVSAAHYGGRGATYARVFRLWRSGWWCCG